MISFTWKKYFVLNTLHVAATDTLPCFSSSLVQQVSRLSLLLFEQSPLPHFCRTCSWMVFFYDIDGDPLTAINSKHITVTHFFIAFFQAVRLVLSGARLVQWSASFSIVPLTI